MITERSSFNTLIKAFLKLKNPLYTVFLEKGSFPDFYYVKRVYERDWLAPYLCKPEKLLIKNYKNEFLEWLEAWMKLQQ